MLKNALLAIRKTVKSNSGAIIIGAAIIIGLNFKLFLSGTQLIWYEVSGQASRDHEEIQRALNLKAKWRQDRKIMTDAWNSFLLASRGNDNPEIKAVKSTSGDFMCMSYLGMDDTRKDRFADMFIKYLNQNAILGRNDWKYEFLNNNFFSDAYTASENIEVKYQRGFGASCEAPEYLYRRNRYQQHIE